MASLIFSLIEQVEEIQGYYRRLLDYTVEKTEILISGDVKKLQEIVFQEEVLATKIKHADANRMQLMKDIAIVMNKKQEEITLTFLMEHMKDQEDVYKRLDALQKNIRTTTDHLRKQNEKNTVLVKESLEMIEYNLNTLQSEFTGAIHPTYDGKDSAVGNNSFFDAKQ